MAERARRSTSLMHLAIMASTAVMPVLLVVLLVVASARQADLLGPPRAGDRHISVRHVAALKTFERAIVRRDRVTSELPTPHALLEHVPQCRAAWEGTRGIIERARRLLTHSIERVSSPAT